MFTLTELASLSERQSSYKILKPWWDVFMEYLVLLMLMVSVLAGTLLLSRDQVVCLPSDPPSQAPGNGSQPSQEPPRARQEPSNSNSHPQTSPAVPHPTPRGRRTHLDYQQYVYISQVCYHHALPWYSRFFPYVALLHSLALLASGSFWFKYPKTSARIEHFIAVLGKCFESPWTSRALSHTAWQDSTQTRAEGTRLRLNSLAGRPSLDSGTDSPLLGREGSAQPAAAPVPPPSPSPSLHPQPLSSSSLSLSSTASLCSFSSSCSPRLSLAPPPADATPSAGPPPSLERSDGETARALFERVRRFRAHSEEGDLVYKVYVAQTVFKVVKFVLIVSYTSPLLGSISFTHECRPQIHALTGYSAFRCTHDLASVLRKLLLSYLALVWLYGLLGLYTLCWIFRRSLREYSFQRVREESSIRDVPDVRNDFAFLLHLADQYDPLPGQRLAVFLSPGSETRLLEESLEQQWGAERLRGLVTRDHRGRTQLHLCGLPRLPPALFSLGQLEVLKLELIPEARLTAQVSRMTALRELHLYHCPARLDPESLRVLRDRLESLHLRVAEAAEIPGWAYALRGLRELHLAGGLAGGLGCLRELRQLRMLSLRGGLRRVPGELGELAGSLARLEVHNEGTRLLALGGLRRLGSGLAELALRRCELEHVPAAVLSLTGLHSLDLSGNALRGLDELLGLAQLRRLTALRLARNRIPALPPAVGLLRGLELLDLSHNRLQALPPALFTLRRLRCLQLAGNLLGALPAEVGGLPLLSELDLGGNRLESLPPELFSGCLRLRRLCAARNALAALPPGLRHLARLAHLDLRGNSLDALPAELGRCASLRRAGLLVEDWLFDTLPPGVRDALQRPESAPSGTPEAPPATVLVPELSPSWALESQI
ncbi:volume-regulated anion channel subunit LRRC8D [Lepisosteus oculatus]|uniref:volume-regulated anion channel subunit LRRC8D n=1 Tax=Lepisosteus oculatus TaxID=7918 RepID=UPI0035F522C9